MSCKVTTVYTKEDRTLTWHSPVTLSPDLEEKYGDKRLIYKVEDLERLLTIEVIWESKALLDQFMAEPEIIAQFEAIKAYHEKNGITVLSRDIVESDKPFLEYLTED
jgi:hypothetical protein